MDITLWLAFGAVIALGVAGLLAFVHYIRHPGA